MPMLHVLFIDFLYRLRDLHGAHVNRYPSLEFHTFLRTNEVILLHDHPSPTPVIYVLHSCNTPLPSQDRVNKMVKMPKYIYVVPSLARTTSKVKNTTQYDLFV